MDGTRLPNIDQGLWAMNMVDGALRMAMPNPSARQAMGLNGVSEKLYEPLGWFLWLDNAPGPYALELLDAQTRGRSLFLVRCYPAPDSPLFSLLSEKERCLRCSPRFDDTGTPVQEDCVEPDSWMFVVGALGLTPKHGDTASGMRVELLTDPGWTQSASWRLYDFMVCLLCHHHGLAAHGAESVHGAQEIPWQLCCDLAPGAGKAPSRPVPWSNPLWWRPHCLGITACGVEYDD